MKYKLEDDNYCFVCGEKNPYGFHLTFSLHDGKAVTEFIPMKVHQGYKDIVHGGIISTLLDETMVKAAILQGIPAITAKITLRFRKPLMVGEKAIIEASIVKMSKKVIEVSANMKKTDNTLIAEGHAKLVRQD
ncbi:MAG: PaaI family thioesterase [Thermodesulfovibrionales bacterium]